MRFGIVSRPRAWLYGEDRSEIRDEIFMGWAVGIIEERPGWLKVATHYGYQGWLETAAVVSADGRMLRERDEAGNAAFVCCGFADVMELPRVRSRVLCTLCRGSIVTLLPERQNGYRKILLADGGRGYLPCIACEGRRDSDAYFYAGEAADSCLLDRKQEKGLPAGYFLRQRQIRELSERAARDRLARYAMSYLGSQYRWGGKSPEGLDCSGLVFMCYQMAGILIYRDAKIMEGYPVKEIPFARSKKGDLLYFPGHVAMYLGDGAYIHATGSGESFGCVINSLSEGDVSYREDLARSMYAAGSIFG